ncbi:MAG TPA: hypothetical protein VEY95_00220 [Azospirillaceae bacterium]|nr:hypothetical protein [Azospirillaceae bacterium]
MSGLIVHPVQAALDEIRARANAQMNATREAIRSNDAVVQQGQNLFQSMKKNMQHSLTAKVDLLA